MFDSASRRNRNVFSASVRYVLNGQIIERTIGCLTQNGRQLGSVLSNELIFLLSKIGKGVNDVYATCTDMGANMLKAADLILESQEQIHLFQQFTEERIEMDVEELLNNSGAAVSDIEDDDHDNNDEHAENEIINISETVGTFCSKMFCGAHVCQLGANFISKKFDSQVINL